MANKPGPRIGMCFHRKIGFCQKCKDIETGKIIELRCDHGKLIGRYCKPCNTLKAQKASEARGGIPCPHGFEGNCRKCDQIAIGTRFEERCHHRRLITSRCLDCDREASQKANADRGGVNCQHGQWGTCYKCDEIAAGTRIEVRCDHGILMENKCRSCKRN